MSRRGTAARSSSVLVGATIMLSLVGSISEAQSTELPSVAQDKIPGARPGPARLHTTPALQDVCALLSLHWIPESRPE
jgi:hypothetical protein